MTVMQTVDPEFGTESDVTGSVSTATDTQRQHLAGRPTGMTDL